MRSSFLLSTALCLVVTTVWPQIPETCIMLEAGHSVSSTGGSVQTPDGGIAIAGAYTSDETAESDLLVTKLDPNGALQWMRTYRPEGLSSYYSYNSTQILNTADGGLMVAGDFFTRRVLLMKLTADGDPEWTKIYADTTLVGALHFEGDGLIELSTGHFALAMAMAPGGFQARMLCVDEQGGVIWSDELTGTAADIRDVAELPNGDLIFIANSDEDPNDVVLRKDAVTGATEWIRWYIPEGSPQLNIHALVIAPDSTIVIAGGHYQSGQYDALVMALSPDGTVQWSTSVGTTGSDLAYNLERAPNGDYVICGWTRPIGSVAQDGFVARVDATGERLWSKRIDHPDLSLLQLLDATFANDGGVLLSAWAESGENGTLFFAKLDADGNCCSYCPFVDAGSQQNCTIVPAPEEQYVFTGPWVTVTEANLIVTDITADASGTYCGSVGVEEARPVLNLSIAPNPMVERAFLTLEGAAQYPNATLVIRDVSGRVVRTQPIIGPSTTIERGALTAGHYVFCVDDGRSVLVRGSLHVAQR